MLTKPIRTVYWLAKYRQNPTKFRKGYLRFIVHKKEVFPKGTNPNKLLGKVSVNKNNCLVYSYTRSLDKMKYLDGSVWDRLNQTYEEFWDGRIEPLN